MWNPVMRSGKLETTPSEPAKPLPKLRPNYKRILESILFLINEAERRGLYVTEFDIDKSIFVADVRHLNEYGRPVTFDNYVATEHGPVPSATRDILERNFKGQPYFTEAWPPWDRVPFPSDAPRAFKFVRPKRKENLRVLSKSDVGALTDALLVVKSLRFGGVKDYTHKHPAYLHAWVEKGARREQQTVVHVEALRVGAFGPGHDVRGPQQRQTRRATNMASSIERCGGAGD
jgi:hypothetical protein